MAMMQGGINVETQKKLASVHYTESFNNKKYFTTNEDSWLETSKFEKD